MLVSVPVASLLVYAIDLRIGRLLAPWSGAVMVEPSWSLLAVPAQWRTLAVAYLSVSAGLVEELVYRAVVFRMVPPRMAYSWRYPALSAVLFGLIHWEQGPAIVTSAGLFGGFMAILYRSSGNLWPSIIGHATVDLIMFARFASRL